MGGLLYKAAINERECRGTERAGIQALCCFARIGGTAREDKVIPEADCEYADIGRCGMYKSTLHEKMGRIFCRQQSAGVTVRVSELLPVTG